MAGGTEYAPSWLKVSRSEYPDASGSERSRTIQSKVWFLRRRRHSAAVAAPTVSTSCEPNSAPPRHDLVRAQQSPHRVTLNRIIFDDENSAHSLRELRLELLENLC